MRECRTSGSVRGVPSNGHPYRNRTSQCEFTGCRLNIATARPRQPTSRPRTHPPKRGAMTRMMRAASNSCEKGSSIALSICMALAVSLSAPQETFTRGTGRMGWEMVVKRATCYWIISGRKAPGQLDPRRDLADDQFPTRWLANRYPEGAHGGRSWRRRLPQTGLRRPRRNANWRPG